MARIVFDLDGTLIDSVPDIHGIAAAILVEDGHAPITLAEAREFVGNGAPVFVARMRAARGIPDSEQDRLLAAFLVRYETAVTRTVPYPNVETSLQRLKAAGHRLGICTNKPIRPCMAVLQHLKLEPYFDTFWGGDSLAVHKPDPAPLHAAFDALSDGPRVYVGDSGVDAETAERASVPFLLFTEGYRKVPVSEMPHTSTFSDFAALPEQIDRVIGHAS